VTLVYRVPRTPSAPRIAIWRRLRRLGVAPLSDGVVALPEDARTLEQLQWVADLVVQAAGTALLLRTETIDPADERAVAQLMASARAEEYLTIRGQASAAVVAEEGDRRRALKRLRRDLREVRRRDFFPPVEREVAGRAVQALAETVQAPEGLASGVRGRS
jgi:hypothetical protein